MCKIYVLMIKWMGEKFVVNITVLESACANDPKDQVRINGANFSGFWSKEIFILILKVHIGSYFGNKYKISFLNYRLIH